MKMPTTVIFLSLLLFCGGQDSSKHSASEISADILRYFQYEPNTNDTFIANLRDYLKDANAVDFSSPKVLSVKGFINKKTATVDLLISWVGESNSTILEVSEDTVQFARLVPTDVDRSLDKEVRISKYLGAAWYRITRNQYIKLTTGKRVKFCFGGAKADKAYTD